MASHKTRLPLLGLAAAGLLFGATAAAAANVMIVRSAGPSAKTYPPGKTIPTSAKIALKPGDMVTLLGSSSARTLRGPGIFSAAPSGNENLALAANRRARFGALRASDYPQNPSPWNVDVSKGGKACVADSSKLMLWRPDTIDTIELSIKPANGAAQTVSWAAGQATLRWPASLPIADGAEYQLQAEGAEPVELAFVTLGGTPPDMVVAARTLMEKGCESQLDVLVEGAGKED